MEWTTHAVHGHGAHAGRVLQLLRLLLLRVGGAGAGAGAARLEPGDDFVEHLLDVLLGLADDLVPHPRVHPERLVPAPCAPEELLDAGRVTDGVLPSVHGEERQLHLLEPSLQLAADAEELERRGGPGRRRGPARRRQRQLPLPLHLERPLGDVPPRVRHPPGRDDGGRGGQQVLERPGGLEPGADPAHGAVEHRAVPPKVLAAEVEEQRDGAAEGLPVEEAGERGRVLGAEGVEGGVAVVEHRVDVGDVALEALGEAVALVVERGDGEPGGGEVDGGQLDHPAGLAGEAVHDGDGAEDWGWGKGCPALGEDAEAPRVDEGGGRVGDAVPSVELLRGQLAERAPLVGLRDWVHHLAAAASSALLRRSCSGGGNKGEEEVLD
ncbi:unnamed protein product [Urochloa decumbens]|uniref:Uncharacterized protein n=1 Tax=Urochloa decumbens TaxID=240449 RepID=A0ABC8ZQ92_9POAL